MTNQRASQATEITEISSRISQSMMTQKIIEKRGRDDDEQKEFCGDNIENKMSLLRFTNELSLFTAEKKFQV